jgi:tetratricopeptide (TPR) repeat protein
MDIDRRVLEAVKTCAGCGKESELLRFRCPHCGSEGFSMVPDQELVESMHGHQKLSQQHVDHGSRLFQQGLLDEALEEFGKALEANPWNATATGNTGVVFLRKGRPEEALKWFERALEIDPHVPGARQMAETARNQLA